MPALREADGMQKLIRPVQPETPPEERKRLLEQLNESSDADLDEALVRRAMQRTYSRRDAAIRLLDSLGLFPRSVSCPYAVIRGDEGWVIVEDRNHEIRDDLYQQKKELAGRTYKDKRAAYLCLNSRGFMLRSPECPYKVVKLAEECWQIQRRTEADKEAIVNKFFTIKANPGATSQPTDNNASHSKNS